ncbi:MAG: hypothetical protein KKA05_01975 [Alphaproteobacteria bacterium]|nr:hypothetical protein [Alphaproteobacteria bacterium]
MSAIIIGMAVTGSIAGGALGFAGSLILAIGSAFSRSSRDHSFLKPTLAGVFLGAALGGGAGWVMDGGVGRYMHETGERAVIKQCLKQIDNGESVTLGKNAAGEVSCVRASAPAP